MAFLFGSIFSMIQSQSFYFAPVFLYNVTVLLGFYFKKHLPVIQGLMWLP